MRHQIVQLRRMLAPFGVSITTASSPVIVVPEQGADEDGRENWALCAYSPSGKKTIGPAAPSPLAALLKSRGWLARLGEAQVRIPDDLIW